MEPIKFKLVKPIQTHKGMLDELELKRPTGGSFVKHGQPYQVTVKGGDTPQIEHKFDAKAMFGFLSDITGIDTMLLEALDGSDVMALFWQITDFVGRRPTNG